MSEPKHTPLPWIIFSDLEDGPVALLPAGRPGEICRFNQFMQNNQANAEFIVRAVNNHDALVEALRDADDALRGMIYDFEHETGENVDADINHTMEKIEQALAKGKDES